MAIYELDNKQPTLPKKDSYWVASNASVIGDIEINEDSDDFKIKTKSDNQLNYAIKLLNG